MRAFEGMQPRLRHSPPSSRLLDQHDLLPELAEPDRGHVAGRSAAEDRDLGRPRVRSCHARLPLEGPL